MILGFQRLTHVLTESKIKMKRTSTAVALSAQNVTTQEFVRIIPTVLVISVKTIYVLVRKYSIKRSDNYDSRISAPEACTDRVKNQDETDIDCGGILCSKCNNTRICQNNSDCISSSCKNNICVRKSIIFVNFNKWEGSSFSTWNMHRQNKKSRWNRCGLWWCYMSEM